MEYNISIEKSGLQWEVPHAMVVVDTIRICSLEILNYVIP